MPVLDVFNNDAFSTISLSMAINRLPVMPGRLGRLGIFGEEGLNSTVVGIEERGGHLYVIPSQVRGAQNRVAATPKARLRHIEVPHFPLDAGIKADDVDRVRNFGTESQLMTIAQMVNQKMQILRGSHEITHEKGRAGAVQGIVFDADGVTPIINLFDEFEVTEESVSFDFGVTAGEPNMNIKAKTLEVIEYIEEQLQGQPYNFIMALVGKTFYRNLVSHPVIEEGFTRIDERFPLEQQREGIEYGDVVWLPYRDKIGANPLIPDNHARFFPVGVPGLFTEYFAPANFIETVGTIGQRLYAKQERQKFDMGIELHSQSNVLPMCHRPQVLVRGTDDT